MRLMGQEVVYYTAHWKNHQRGYLFDMSQGGISRTGMYLSLADLYDYGRRLAIPIDPVTAISMGLVTPEEINLPEGLQAAFNLLK